MILFFIVVFVVVVIFLLLFLFFFLLLLLRLIMNLLKDVINRLRFLRLLRLDPFLIRIVIDPREPCPSLANIFDDYEIVTVSIGPFDPVLEAGVLEL